MVEETGYTVKIYKNIMSANEEWASKTRALLSKNNTVMINIIGSPGSGKTGLLEHICPLVMEKYRCIVLEGDVETARDAERLAGKKIHAHQIVTKGACHLSAQTIYQVLSDQNLENMNFVFVENVGNLVCPAEFDIGETCKIAVLSVTEGEDKPLKYPLLFRDSRAVVLTKMDLIPHLDVDADMYQKNIRNVNNNIPVYPVSAKTGDGLAKLLEWLFNLR